MSRKENISERNRSAEDHRSMTPRQQCVVTEGANGGGNFPPDPMGTVYVRQEQPPINSSSSSDNNILVTSPVLSSSFEAVPTPPIFTFAPPPPDFPLQLKILHILVAHIGNGEQKEKITCRLQSPSAVAKGDSGFVVEHELGPFNRTDKVFADHRFRDLERRSQASVAEFGSKFVELQPPPPMNTLTMLCLASDRLQMDPQVTIELARKLNKIGLISSPLTSADKYSAGFPRKEMVSAMVLHLDELCGVRLNAQDVLLNFVRPNHRLGSMEPIHPLLVDHKDTKYKRALNDDELARKLYELICRYFLSTCMRPSKIAEMTIKFSIGPEIFKSTKHTVVIDGFLLVAPWMQPEYSDTELPTEATKLQNQFVKQTFIVSDVQRCSIEKPKGGLSEAKLISQMALLELGNYGTIPETLSKMVQKKLANVIEPGRWIVPTSEGLQKLESFRHDGFETDCEQEQTSDRLFEDQNDQEDESVEIGGCFRNRIELEANRWLRLEDAMQSEIGLRLVVIAVHPRKNREANAFQTRTKLNAIFQMKLLHVDSRWWTAAMFALVLANLNSISDISVRKEKASRECLVFLQAGHATKALEVIPRQKFMLATCHLALGSAFVDFARVNEAKRAISEMDGRSLDGLILKVKCQQKRPFTELSKQQGDSQLFSPGNKFARNVQTHPWQKSQQSSPSKEYLVGLSAKKQSPDHSPRIDKHSGFQSVRAYPWRTNQQNSSSDELSVQSPHKKMRFADQSATFGTPTSYRPSPWAAGKAFFASSFFARSPSVFFPPFFSRRRQ
uniref:DNA topoisomerase n=1 Tax=Globodera rostochiensis TaxID=31243 RepID=A0A914I5Y2_GLORO